MSIITKPKFPSIKYTNRDFNSIRNDLLEYAKRYYPDTYRDFNEASFGALMVDSLAYIGDMLSFYLDYQANESFLPTAIEYQNIVKHGKAMGYKANLSPSSHGILTFFIKIPANATGLGIDNNYVPILKKNSTFTSSGGTTFTLNEDVNFGNHDSDIIVSNVNSSTGVPTYYAIKAYGRAVSGGYTVEEFTIGDFERFKKIRLNASNITEIISVSDANGNEYFEVDYLSQDIIYKPVPNASNDRTTVSSLLKPFSVPRRFAVERDRGTTFIQFGYGNEEDLSNEGFINPEEFSLDIYGRQHITDTSFDPSRLSKTDKFGISPSKTVLRVVYRSNSRANVNAAVNTITKVSNPIIRFDNQPSLTATQLETIRTSLEVTNDEAVVGSISSPTADETRRRIYDVYAAQNRAVTKQDYKALIYMMPSEFGAIKRCQIVQDPNAFRRNLNVYILAEDPLGNLSSANATIKENLKNWLNHYKMINDTVDILDAKIVNIAIDFTIIPDIDRDKFEILQLAKSALKLKLTTLPEIGESFNIASIYKTLNAIDGIADTVNISITRSFGAISRGAGQYSNVDFNIKEHLSPDGRILLAPDNIIFEVRNLERDIRGAVR